MKIQRLAHFPSEVVIPGDRYDELPPKPRVRFKDGSIDNIAREVVELWLDPECNKDDYDIAAIEPGLTGMMALDGECLGINADLAVWRFGWTEKSRHTRDTGVQITCNDEVGYGFLWVLATRKSGKIKETFRGWALNMPENFKKVVDAPVIIESGAGEWGRISVQNVRK